ncbi:hypothetical protein Syun_020778 [Stephania yunnanensis]|uniref:Uncharacterized protein n=1 Tax=Stephania yunnanensis TaxID=152371 RepID=A0AAP0NRQ9_9MAGN
MSLRRRGSATTRLRRAGRGPAAPAAAARDDGGGDVVLVEKTKAARRWRHRWQLAVARQWQRRGSGSENGVGNGVEQRRGGALPNRSILDETRQQWTIRHDFDEAR